MYSPESNRQGLEDTAGDRAGLVAGGVLLGGTAVVGGAAVAVNALFLTETGSLVLWTGGTGQTAAGFGSTLSSTTGGKFLEALSSMGVKVPEAVWRQSLDLGPQRLYPHCLNCSRTQGGQVRGAGSGG